MTKKEIRLNVPVNWYCNQKCIFCGEGDKKELSYLKGNEDKYVYEMIDAGLQNHNSIMFTSGEPTLNKNICSYIKYAKDKGYKTISLITNGIKLKDDKLRKKIIDSGLTEITFSIHGSNSIIHDYNTGTKGSFDNTIQSLIKFKKENKDITVYLNFILNRSNLSDFYNYVYKFSKFNIDKILVHSMRPDGHGKDKMKNLSIRFVDFIDYISGLGNEKLSYINLLIKTNKLLITDVPICILKKSGIYVDPHIRDEKMETRNMGKINIVDFSEEKTYVDKCKKCEDLGYCNGVFKDYINLFGENEL